MTVTEAARFLEIPTQTLYAKIHRGKGVGVEFTKKGPVWSCDGRALKKYKKDYPRI